MRMTQTARARPSPPPAPNPVDDRAGPAAAAARPRRCRFDAPVSAPAPAGACVVRIARQPPGARLPGGLADRTELLRHRDDPARAYAFVVQTDNVSVDRITALIEQAREIGMLRVA